MPIPYRARVDERWFLNLPGFGGDAYILAFVEDTSECGPRHLEDCDDDRPGCPDNFEPKAIIELLGDGMFMTTLEFEVRSERRRANSLHKLDTLIAALKVFRKGLVEEFAEYDRREKELEELKGE
jgi:hypothetical protein